MTVMGEVLVKELSDAGSIPARSTFGLHNVSGLRDIKGEKL